MPPLGALLAVLVILVAIILGVMHMLDPIEAGMFAALGLARLT